ncbi:MAG: hypothetical protein IJ748_03470 [Bacteroidales bacterium]|nr:hypothetical protein [Bacteroidales bacterium]
MSIIDKLNKFIRSYYKNLVIRGIVYSVLLLTVFFIALSLTEYFGWQSQIVRTIIFYSYIVLAIFVLFWWVLIPLSKMFSIGKTLTQKQAAGIIGKHFSEIKDKLLNLLELQDLRDENGGNSLLMAAIEQKTENLSPLPFNKAINKRKTYKYARILLGVLVIFVVLFCLFPKLFSEPAVRYLNHNTFYEKPAPFTFLLKSKTEAIQHGDADVRVEISGDVLPDRVRILLDGQSLEMKKKSREVFVYTIPQIQKTTLVQFEALGVKSKIYKINVNPKPVLTDITAEIIYPKYTGIKQEVVKNVTDLSLPEGSRINWILKSKDTKEILFKSNDNLTVIGVKNDIVKFTSRYTSSQSISIKMRNRYTTAVDSLAFFINTVKDERPQIAVIEEKDVDVTNKIYFRGQIKDDYGFSQLNFQVKITSNKKETKYKRNLPFTIAENAQEFYYVFDLDEYSINPGDKLEYFFEVWDNDGINGAKCNKTQQFSFSVATEEEIDRKTEDNSKDIKKDTDKALKEIKDLQKKINELTKRLTENKELTWKDKQDLDNLKAKQEKIKDEVRKIKEKLEENSLLEEKYNRVDEELLEKQMEIERLFNQLEDKELKDLMKQIEDLTKKNLNKDKMNEMLQSLKNKNEDLSKQLDKNLELFKRLEVDKDINNAIEKLRKLSEKQKELSKETSDKKHDKSDILDKQNEINKEFNDIKKKLNEIEKKDSQLETPFNLKREEQKEQSIDKNLKQAKESIEKNKNKDASQNQNEASEQMEQMAADLEQAMADSQDEQLAEDIDNVRQILKNLVTLSKDEEALISLSQTTGVNNPAYQNIINKQNVIKEALKDISDSLYNISKRQAQVSQIIHEETFKVNNSIEKSLADLLKYNQSVYNSMYNNQAATAQQYAMTSMNNLSLLLAESLDKMNQQQNQSKSKNGKASQQCKNPSSSGGKQDIKSMKKLQEALNKEIERLQKELEKQGNKSNHRIGEGKELNEALAKAAAQQEMIRKMMEEYLRQLKQEKAKAVGGMNKALKSMEETEKDIVNKKINANTIKRQNEILTRMLESERAEKKKEKDNERKSNTGVDKKQNDDKNFEAFKKLKDRNVELFKEIPPVYSSYYKGKINKYFYNFENSKEGLQDGRK